MNIIQVNNIVKDFIGHRALNDVSFGVPEAQVFGLLGPNGAGKTTLLRIINQINFPDSGEVFFDGRAITASDVKQIGYLPEERGLYKKMKLGEQAIYLSRLKGYESKDLIPNLKIWFEKFNLTKWWDKSVDDLSKGMAQKLQFIVTVVHKPKLLIFDEPFSGFDPVNANILKSEILDLKKQGTSIIFSTHNMSSVEEVCDNIVLLNQSEKLLEGNVEEIRENFSENKYEIIIDSEKLNSSSQLYSIMDQKHLKGNSMLYNLKLTNTNSTNEVLAELCNQGNIISFRKVLPSMNDIFIKSVEQNS